MQENTRRNLLKAPVGVAAMCMVSAASRPEPAPRKGHLVYADKLRQELAENYGGSWSVNIHEDMEFVMLVRTGNPAIQPMPSYTP